jgi:hypothetical protein
MRSSIVVACVLGLALSALPPPLEAQTCLASQPRIQAPPPSVAEAVPVTAPRPSGLFAEITLADIGFANGIRFAKPGRRRELFVPVPQAPDIAASELVLVLDDVSAHDARRNLEVQINDRTAISPDAVTAAAGRAVSS